MKLINTTTTTVLLTAILTAATVSAQTLVPKWSTNAIGANQIYCNGMGLVPSTGDLIVSQCAGSTATIFRYLSATGASAGTNMNTTGISGGTYIIGGLTVGSDGVIYACNYAAAGATKLYYWTNENAAPVQLGSTFTVGVGSIGKNLTVNGTGTNAVFLISSTTTGPLYIHNNGTNWVAAQLAVTTQSCQSQLSFVNSSSSSCQFVSKNSAASGFSSVFNPAAASPITVTQTAISGFVSGSGTIQSVAFDPSTSLMGTYTRTLPASPYTVTINTWMAGGVSGSVTNPIAETPQTTNALAADGGTIGDSYWFGGRFYCVPAVANLGIFAFDVTAFAVSNVVPSSQTVSPGQSASFSIVSGGSALSYAWKLNGTNVSGSEFIGATSPTLTISPATSADQGTYNCVVSGVSNSTWTSSNAVLIVISPKTTPSFTNLTASSSTIYGSSNVILSGEITSAGTAYPTNGETITVTINGNVQSTTITDAIGDFSLTYLLTNLSVTATPYSITYSYAGDGSLNAASNATTTLTILPLPVILTGTRVYDGTATATNSILSVTNSVGGDDVSVSSGSAILASAAVGTNAITSVGTLTLGGVTATNYTLIGSTGSVVITDPGLPYSIISTSVDSTGTNLVLISSSIPGDIYQLLSSTDLMSWTNYGTPVTAVGTLTTNIIPIDPTSVLPEFYVYKNEK